MTVPGADELQELWTQRVGATRTAITFDKTGMQAKDFFEKFGTAALMK